MARSEKKKTKRIVPEKEYEQKTSNSKRAKISPRGKTENK